MGVQRSVARQEFSEVAKASSREADFDQLIVPLIEPAYRLALSMLDTPADAEDAVQESALRAWRSLHQLRRANPRPWFLAIVARRCLTLRRNRWRSLLGLQHREVSVQPLDDSIVARSDLSRALRRLPPQLRIVLFLHYYLDLSLAEVAATLGITIGATKTRIHRALARLRPHLSDIGEDADAQIQ